MITISIEHETDTAHRLTCHQGKCANLHGHRYKFVVTIEGSKGIEDKAFVDFYRLKALVREVLDRRYDHAVILCDCLANANLIELLVAEKQVVRLMQEEPTVEAMVQITKEALSSYPLIGDKLCQLTIYETPTNYCTWTRETR